MTPRDPTPSGEITRLVVSWSQGDETAFDRLIELVYDDLRRIAHRHLELGAPDAILDRATLTFSNVQQ